jgi:NH3-dependent NAD+ synthetase
MINGRFVVLGSPTYLMATYGLGYSFTITIDANKISQAKAKSVIYDKLPSAEFINERETQSNSKFWYLNYKVLNVKGGRTLENVQDQKINLSELFEKLSELTEQGEKTGLM